MPDNPTVSSETGAASEPQPASKPKSDSSDAPDRRRLAALSLTALGVVYGDIGTSPLYAVRECFIGNTAMTVPLSHENVLGVLSLIFWSLLLVISLKYLTFVMRADNDGEGGILALMMVALPRHRKGNGRTRWLLTAMGLFGAGLLYGDGMITPAISVLSAIEGIEVATPAFNHLIVPVTLVILLLLFLFQSKGTARVGGLFGPVMLVWFTVIAVLGIVHIVRYPAVLAAVNPYHAVMFFVDNRLRGFIVLGVVFLVVTGGEALYADMGHFGRWPIRIAWFTLVLPALLLNYFGQGAMLLAHEHPETVTNPFYHMAPSWGLYPLMVLATVATVIASQAVISGAFSLSIQAVQLGYFPRMRYRHTSKDERGQIYVPAVNWLLFAAVVGLVVWMESSSRLAAAYGMAITTTMVITAVLLYLVARHRWGWSTLTAGALVGLFLIIDLAFFGANLIKILDGGWFPLLVGGAICLTMLTWWQGRKTVAAGLTEQLVTTGALLEQIARDEPVRIDSPAVFLGTDPNGVPLALLHNLRHNRVLHRPVALLTIVFEDEPWVPLEGRLEFESLGQGVYRIIAHYGFKQGPNVPNIVDQCRQHNVDFTGTKTAFFLSRVTLDAARGPMPAQWWKRLFIWPARWRKLLFVWLTRNANDASAYFNIPAGQVVEIGVRLEV